MVGSSRARLVSTDGVTWEGIYTTVAGYLAAMVPFEDSIVAIPASNPIVQSCWATPSLGLANLSGRGPLASSDATSIAGFVIEGDPMTILARGVGPSLPLAGDVAQDPWTRVYRGGTVIPDTPIRLGPEGGCLDIHG